MNGLNDFAVTGLPVHGRPADARSTTAGKTVQYAPITTSGLVLAYKMFDQDPAHGSPGAQVTDLKLTPQLVAQIFTGQLTQLARSIRTSTRSTRATCFPPTVRPLVRGDHSVANLEFTSWLTAEGGSGLPADWPGASASTTRSNYLTQNSGIVGGDALADAIADPSSVRTTTTTSASATSASSTPARPPTTACRWPRSRTPPASS